MTYLSCSASDRWVECNLTIDMLFIFLLVIPGWLLCFELWTVTVVFRSWFAFASPQRPKGVFTGVELSGRGLPGSNLDAPCFTFCTLTPKLNLLRSNIEVKIAPYCSCPYQGCEKPGCRYWWPAILFWPYRLCFTTLSLCTQNPTLLDSTCHPSLLLQASVMSRLNYSNALQSGLPTCSTR